MCAGIDTRLLAVIVPTCNVLLKKYERITFFIIALKMFNFNNYIHGKCDVLLTVTYARVYLRYASDYNAVTRV